MSILTEKEREDVYKYWLHSSTLTNEDGLIQLAERAVLEKLAGMELPEPYGHDVYVEEADNGYIVYSLDDAQLVDDATNHGATTTALYTAAQLHQAYAQGAASQLAQDPFAWISSKSVYRLNNGGNNSKGTVPVYANRTSVSKLPLYTLKTLK